MYKEGLHIISEFSVKDPEVLKDCEKARDFFDNAIRGLGLEKIGEIYHQFPGSGYTGVVCLTESHISIHTWPEYNRATFDVFLSNYLKYNNDLAEKIHNDLLILLEAADAKTTRLKR